MRHKFYLPIGMPTFSAPPSANAAELQSGDTYFDTTIGQVRTWDAVKQKWVTGGGTLTAGLGLEGTGTSMADDITLHVKTGPGVKITADAVTVDPVFIQDQIKAALPIGMISMWAGDTAPAGWKICDGTAHGSAELAALIGPNTPNLKDRFIVGSGGNYDVGATGGAAAVRLTGGESGIRNHAHTGTTGWMNQKNTHAHAARLNDAGEHRHNSYGANFTSSEAGNDPASGTGYYYLAQTPPQRNGLISGGLSGHLHGGVTVDAADINHQHSFTTGGVADADARDPHENRPPYYALMYVIKVA